MEKLKRAEVRTHELNAKRDQFVRDSPQSIALKARYDIAKWEVRIIDVPPTPIILPILLGEALQGLRSALDHLAFHLTWTHHGPAFNLNKTAFPVFMDPNGDYETASNGARNVGLTHPLVQAFIEWLQPFRSLNPEDTALCKLNKLNNRDKHRALVATNLSITDATLQFIVTGPPPFNIVSVHTVLVPKLTRLVDNAVLGYIPLVTNSQVQMNGGLVTDVLVDEAPWGPMEVFDLLAGIWNFITRQVIAPLRPYLGLHPKYLNPDLFELRRSEVVQLAAEFAQHPLTAIP